MIIEFNKNNPNYRHENKSSYPCKFYQMCNNASCSYFHNVDYITRQKIIKIVANFKKTGCNTCKKNATCNNINCNLNHSVDVITRESIITLVNEFKIAHEMESIKNIYDHKEIEYVESIEPKFKDVSTNTDTEFSTCVIVMSI